MQQESFLTLVHPNLYRFVSDIKSITKTTAAEVIVAAAVAASAAVTIYNVGR